MNTLTPRTDKAVQESNGQWSFAMRNLCIQMECEIAALTNELAEAREDAANQRRLADMALAHRDVIIAERDTLEEALRQVRAICLDKSIETHPDEHAKGTIDDCIDIAESALAVKGGKA
jgi:hypothetical protein